MAAARGREQLTASRPGGTIGGGAEWVLSGQWTAKLEYLYVDLGSVGITFTVLGSYPTLGASSHITDSIVRVGLNYRFGGLVVARYRPSNVSSERSKPWMKVRGFFNSRKAAYREPCRLRAAVSNLAQLFIQDRLSVFSVEP